LGEFLIEAFLIVSGPGPGLQWKGRSWGGSRTRGEEAEERSHRSPLYGSRTGCGLAAESRKWPPKNLKTSECKKNTKILLIESKNIPCDVILTLSNPN